jgi:carbonic anhydrase
MSAKFSIVLTFIVALIGVSLVRATDYSEHGANWSGTCMNGTSQSPINIVPSSTVLNSQIAFQTDYEDITTLTVNISSDGNQVYVNYPSGSTLNFYN